MNLTQTLQDQFFEVTVDSQWFTFGTVTVTPGTLTMLCDTSYSGIVSQQYYDLTGSFVYCNPVPYTGTGANTQTMLLVSNSGSTDQITMGYYQGDLVCNYIVNGTTTNTYSTTYSATTHAWWRIRESGGTTYWDVSSNGVQWTNVASVADPFLYSAGVNLSVQTGTTSGTSSGNTTMSNFSTGAFEPNSLSMVKVTTGGRYYSQSLEADLATGPASVSPGNTEGNLLLVIAAWSTDMTAVPTVAGAVSDDQGNWWRYIGDSGQAGAGIRAGIWLCSNALAVTQWLSFMPQGVSGAFAFQVVEMKGFPASYWPEVDFCTAVGTGGDDTFTYSSDFVVILAAGGPAPGNTITQSVAGWTAIGTAGSGVNTGDEGVTLYSEWATLGKGTLVDYSFTITPPSGASLNTVYMLTGFTMASSLPVQARPVFPKIVVEGYFGATPGDPTVALLDQNWTDMSQFALGKQGQVAISAQRGQQYELSQPESGQMTIAMNNQAGDFNPQWAGSQFYSNAINDNMAMQQGTPPFGWEILNSPSTITFAASTEYTFASATGAYANQSLQVNPDTDNSTTTIVYPFTDSLNVSYEYTLSVWVYFPAGYNNTITWACVLQNAAGAGSVATTTVNSIPAATWTQLTVNSGNITSDLSYNVLWGYLNVEGSPTAPFYLAEVAAVQGSEPVSTGLVRLSTPVRTSCYWNGRRYPIGFGYVERWPQDWPDFPQWGWSKLIATDVVGVAASVNLPSAVQGEILTDSPYLCFPFSEQYTSATVSASGTTQVAAECDGLIAVNTALNNQRTATYTDGTVQVATGNSLNLFGDSGTGMGATGYTAVTAASGLAGPGAIYGPDYSLPSVDSGPVMVEFWLAVTPPATGPTSALRVKLMDVIVQQDYTSYLSGVGVLATVGMVFPAASPSNPYLMMNTNASATTTSWTVPTLGPGGEATFYGANLPQTSSLIQVVFNNGTATVYYMGTFEVGSVAYDDPYGSIIALVFGNSVYSTGTTYGGYNYTMGYGTLYSHTLPWYRMLDHATSGQTGFIGDSFTDRAARYQQWANLNLGLTGPQDTVSQLGPAYATDGSPLANALNTDALSTNSRWTGIGNGNLVVLSRQAQYDQPITATFGDSPVGVLNSNPDFQSGLTGWTAENGATASIAPVLFDGHPVAQFTGNGSTAVPYIQSQTGVGSIVAGSTYTMVAWICCPAGWGQGMELYMDWYDGGTYLSVNFTTTGPVAAGSSFMPVALTATAPATANNVQISVRAAGTPPTSVTFQVGQVQVQMVGDQVPYLPNQGMDYDNTYVSNVVKATLQQGPTTLAAPTLRNQSSVLEYFQRGPLQQNVSGVTSGDAYDRANWSIGKYQQPSMRVRSITVVPSAHPSSFRSVLETDVSDPVMVLRDPLNPTRYNLPVVTQLVEHQIGPGRYQVTYQQSPYVPEGNTLVTDKNGYDVLGSNALAW